MFSFLISIIEILIVILILIICYKVYKLYPSISVSEKEHDISSNIGKHLRDKKTYSNLDDYIGNFF